MGQFISSPTATDPIISQVNEQANIYFQEYQLKCINDRNFLLKENARWENAMPSILSQPIENQAEYADYVTNRICELPNNILLPFVRHSLGEIPPNLKDCGACAIGNTAKLILMLPEDEQIEHRLRLAYSCK